jgi:transcriptional regulator with XRE-family HTH domain
MITPAQSKMARAGLGWSIKRLALAAKVGVATVARFEIGKGEIIPATQAAIQRALEAAGVEFLLDNGVRLKAPQPSAPSGGSGPGGASKPGTTAKPATPAQRKPGRQAEPAQPQSKEAQIRALRESARE